MFAARLWHGYHVIACWIVGIVAVVLLRWALFQGVYETAFVDGRVERVAGLWAEDLVSLITVVAAGNVLVVLAGLTFQWLLGRKDRAALRENTVLIHRRILM